MKRYNRRERVNHLHKQKIQQERFNETVQNRLNKNEEDVNDLFTMANTNFSRIGLNENTIKHHRQMFSGIGNIFTEMGQAIQNDAQTDYNNDGNPLVPKNRY